MKVNEATCFYCHQGVPMENCTPITTWFISAPESERLIFNQVTQEGVIMLSSTGQKIKMPKRKGWICRMCLKKHQVKKGK